MKLSDRLAANKVPVARGEECDGTPLPSNKKRGRPSLDVYLEQELCAARAQIQTETKAEPSTEGKQHKFMLPGYIGGRANVMTSPSIIRAIEKREKEQKENRAKRKRKRGNKADGSEAKSKEKKSRKGQVKVRITGGKRCITL